MQLGYNIFGGCELFRHSTKFLYFLPPLCWGTLFHFFDFSFVKLSGLRVWVQVVLENCDGTVVGTGTGKSGTGDETSNDGTAMEMLYFGGRRPFSRILLKFRFVCGSQDILM
jgi:hypothetical protein